jgi:hypothetical protein
MLGTFTFNIGTRDNKDKTTHYGCPHPHSPIPLRGKVTWKHPFYDYFRLLRVFCKQASKDEVPRVPGGSGWQGEIMTVESPPCSWCLFNVGEVEHEDMKICDVRRRFWQNTWKPHIYIYVYVYIYSLWFHTILSVPMVNIDFAGLVISIGPRVGFLLATSIEYHWFVSILLLQICSHYLSPLLFTTLLFTEYIATLKIHSNIMHAFICPFDATMCQSRGLRKNGIHKTMHLCNPRGVHSLNVSCCLWWHSRKPFPISVWHHSE